MPKRQLSEDEKEKNRLRARLWGQKNRARAKAKASEWRKKNPERHKENCRNSYLNNKEHRAAYRTEYDRTHKDVIARKSATRRAKKLEAEGFHSSKDIANLLLVQGGKCAYCRQDVSKAFEVDHIVPLAKGGTNFRSNLQILCKKCNSRKSDKSPEAFARELGLLV